MSRHLLVPMDDSAYARDALAHAMTVHPEAEITVVHAVDDFATSYGGRPPVIDRDETGAESDRSGDERSNGDRSGDEYSESAATVFDAAREIAEEYDRGIETAQIDGAPAEAIVAFGDAEGVDGIVIGTAGRSGVSRVLLGSIAESVARNASVPVTVVS